MADILPFPNETPLYTVLVVDDEPVIRAVVCEFLKDSGLNPIAADDADEAVALLSQDTKIDLVFSDVRMPGSLDGYGLARWILENRPALPVILVSGDLGKANAAPGLTGVETFAKPYDFDAAVRKIRATLERGSQKTG